jgi:phosphoribosylformylglycinamidine synthase
VAHQHLGGRPPKVDFAREQAIASIMERASKNQLVHSAHDLSDGGLAQALVEACLRRDFGADIKLPGTSQGHNAGYEAFNQLFSESAGRVLVSVGRGHRQAFESLVAEHEVPLTELGVVTTQGSDLNFADLFSVPLDELRTAWTETLPRLFGGAAQTPAPQDAEPATDEPVTAEAVTTEA